MPDAFLPSLSRSYDDSQIVVSPTSELFSLLKFEGSLSIYLCSTHLLPVYLIVLSETQLK